MGAAWSEVVSRNSLLAAFVIISLIIWFSYFLSARLTRGHVHGSAIAIAIGLALAYAGGAVTGGENGVADFPLLAGVGVLGGSMFRDFAIVATAFGARLDDLRDAGLVGASPTLLRKLGNKRGKLIDEAGFFA